MTARRWYSVAVLAAITAGWVLGLAMLTGVLR
jgi:hypothetical protein